MKALLIVGKSLLAIIGIILLSLIFIIVWIRINSTGKTTPFTDEKGNIIEGSIAEIEKVNLNGIEQFLLIRGKNTEKPVLLMLHGGPGSPQVFMDKKYNRELEDHYIVVNWDQRGAGASYFEGINSETLSIDLLIEDTRQLTEYLANKFNKDKIFILGHSWGSYLGMRTVHKYPELFHAYIGVGQVANQRKSEQISYEFVLNKATNENNTKAIKQLRKIGYPTNGLYKELKSIDIQRRWVMYYGGAAYKCDAKDAFSMIILSALKFKEYRLSDKIKYVKGMKKSFNILWMPLMNEQLCDIVHSVEIPVYFLHGKHDYQTTYCQSKAFFDKLQAPEKTFVEFSNSAHMLPYNSEKDKFHSVVRNIAIGIR
jgi:pimeloyl-ACP methyl ester carboxylesterase